LFVSVIAKLPVLRPVNVTEFPPEAGHFGSVSLFGFGLMLKHH